MIAMWRNKKTKLIYRVVSEGIDTTNERDGLPIIIYRKLERDPYSWFVRSKEEFMQKFEPVYDDITIEDKDLVTIKFACHADNEYLDFACVFDRGERWIEECGYAEDLIKSGKGKDNCIYWRSVEKF